jgi:glycosyltransferase involved in cell wall biosynthesis
MAGSGTDTTRFDPARVDDSDVRRIRQELGLNEDDILFLMIGEYTARKRHGDALRALARLADPKVHLAFAGIGRLMDPTQTTAAALGLGSQTHFLGYRTDIPTLIRASRATILPSSAEGVPACVRESLAMEVPAIGTDVRGTHELLEDGCGILVPSGDVQALAEAMRWMVEHPDEALGMGRKGRQKMPGRYELRHVLQQTEALYREVLLDAGQPTL